MLVCTPESVARQMEKYARWWDGDIDAFFGKGALKSLPGIWRGAQAVGRGMGAVGSFTGRNTAKAIQWAGDKVWNNPRRALMTGLPSAYLLSQAPETFSKNMDNKNPYIPYRR